MTTHNFLESSIAYITRETAQHVIPQNTLVVWEIQRLQCKLLWLNQIVALCWDDYTKEQKAYDKAHIKEIAHAIAQLKKTYWLSDNDIARIEGKYAAVKFWN